MGWRTLSIGVLLLLASCTDQDDPRYAVPGTLMIDRIERALATLPCVGALDRWERHYYYTRPLGDSWRVDRNRIAFSLIEASRPPYSPRRVLYGEDLDEVSPPTVSGEFHVASGRFILLACRDEGGPLTLSRIEAFIRLRDTP